MFRGILLAWDGSPPAEWAFDVALDLARRYDARLCAASVAYSPAHAETRADREESIEAARRYLLDTFAQVRDRAERAGVEVEHVLLESDEPAAELLAYAHEHGFGLLVVGHHRKSRSGRFAVHGLTQRVLESADLPVLVVTDSRVRR